MIARIASAVLLGVLSVGPPDEGVNVTGQGGGGRYQYRYSGCEHVDPHVYGANTAQAYGALNVRQDHFAISVEGTVQPGRVTRASCEQPCNDPAPDLGHDVQVSMGAARAGGQWAYGGFELGIAGGSHAPGGTERPFPAGPLPSASLWAGVPDAAFAWATLAAGAGPPGIFLGIGHRDEDFGVAAGIGGDFIQHEGPSLAITGDWKVHPQLWPGIDVRYHDGQQWTAAVRLTLHFPTPR